jgi:hypothetical protein
MTGSTVALKGSSVSAQGFENLKALVQESLNKVRLAIS